MQTPNLNLPYIIAAQAQKEVTHAEALNLLDALVQTGVIARHIATPPVSPDEGDLYIVALSPTDEWAGFSGYLAYYIAGNWQMMLPKIGWRCYVQEEQLFVYYTGSDWQVLPLVVMNALVSALPSAAAAGRLLYVTDETDGAVLAVADGSQWRRVTDRAVVS